MASFSVLANGFQGRGFLCCCCCRELRADGLLLLLLLLAMPWRRHGWEGYVLPCNPTSCMGLCKRLMFQVVHHQYSYPFFVAHTISMPCSYSRSTTAAAIIGKGRLCNSLLGLYHLNLLSAHVRMCDPGAFQGEPLGDSTTAPSRAFAPSVAPWNSS